MLQAALDEHPDLPVLLKVHPDVVAGRKRGHFDSLSAGAASRVALLATEAHAPSLLERAAAVYAVTSQLGFEALLWQRPVRCFGMPFYAGWGLTRDALAPPDRRNVGRAVTFDALVDAALVQYPRYLDPETRRRCEVERLIDHLELQRGMRTRFAPAAHAIGFSRWKKPIARAFFSGSELRFLRRAPAAPQAMPVVVWGAKPAPAQRATLRVEDGFIRSVGLGADLTRPLSWVQDDLGIYFDATKPSRLEVLLQDSVFTPELLQRA
jgi:capsular polysaccharide export protein